MAYKVDPGGRSRFAKLGMAINDELTQSCRDILEMEVPPALIFRKVKSSSLYQKLRPDQELILRNAAKSGYNEFDCTLLYMLLRNICSNFKIPTKGWGGNVMPAAGDVTVGDDIERIRLIRNDVYAHASSAFISPKDFDKNWAIISDVCRRLETFTGKKYCDGLIEILAQSFDEEDEENIIEKIKRDCENDKSVRDLLSLIIAMMEEFRAAISSMEKGTRVKVLSIESEAKEKKNNSQAISVCSMIKETLNQMMDAINKKSTEEDICNLQSSFELYMDSIPCDDDKMSAMNLLEKMKKTIHKYAGMHPDKIVTILNNFVRFLYTLQQNYKLSDVHLQEGSILFRMTFASENGYRRFIDDMKKGIVNQYLMDFFSDPYILSVVGLAEKDITISITDLNEKEWKKIELHSIKERDIAQQSDSEDSSDESFVDTSAGYRKFEEAKQCALDIFDSVGNLLSRVDDAISGAPENIRDIFTECRDTKSWFSESRKILEKEKMKVVVFGSTSTGKSTTLNALLHKRLLPSGMGHITNCFYQIQGSTEQSSITLSIDTGEEKDISEFNIYTEQELLKLSPENVVYITCPKSEFPALGEAIFMDSPGLDRTKELDKLIFNLCEDADVFVYVSDAKSTLRVAELSFFEKIEKPTVFILFNFWDIIDKSEKTKQQAQKLRQKHIEDACDLLKKTNRSVHFTNDDLKDKIYFVSAEEYLEEQESAKGGFRTYGEKVKNVDGNSVESAPRRMEEFIAFEKTFWEYTKDSALNIRFRSKIERGKHHLEKIRYDILLITRQLEDRRAKIEEVLYKLEEKMDIFPDIKEDMQRKNFQAICKLMEQNRLQECAKTYIPTFEVSEQKTDLYLQGLHDYLVDDIKQNLREIHALVNRKKTSLETSETASFFEDILTEDSLDEFQILQANYEKNAELTFELPPKTNAEYAWSLGPYTLWKKTRYTSYFDKQSTTSTGRAVVQTGGLGATAAGCALATLTPFMLPIVGLSATAGSMFMYLHYKYDKSKWTSTNRIEFLQELCVANIHYQFETKYGVKWWELLSELDKERYGYLYENIEKSRNTNVEMKKKVQKVLTDLKKFELEDKIIGEIKRLEEFQRKYLQTLYPPGEKIYDVFNVEK